MNNEYPRWDTMGLFDYLVGFAGIAVLGYVVLLILGPVLR